MPTPTDPTPLRRRDRLRARVGSAKRRAAVVASAGLLTAGGAGIVVAPSLMSTATDVAVTEAAPERPAPPPATLLPPSPAEVPVAPVSHRAAGDSIEPLPDAGAGVAIEGGRASYYGRELAGNPTASGEPFDPAGLTAAHRTLPLGTYVRVTHVRTGQSVVVRINDRGPFHGDRVIDVSRAAADAIGLTQAGTGVVELEQLPGGVRG